MNLHDDSERRVRDAVGDALCQETGGDYEIRESETWDDLAIVIVTVGSHGSQTAEHPPIDEVLVEAIPTVVEFERNSYETSSVAKQKSLDEGVFEASVAVSFSPTCATGHFVGGIERQP